MTDRTPPAPCKTCGHAWGIHNSVDRCLNAQYGDGDVCACTVYVPDETDDPLVRLLDAHGCEVNYDGQCVGCQCGPQYVDLRKGVAPQRHHRWHAEHVADIVRRDAVSMLREVRTIVGREVQLHLLEAGVTRPPRRAWVQSLTIADTLETPDDDHQLVLYVAADQHQGVVERRG